MIPSLLIFFMKLILYLYLISSNVSLIIWRLIQVLFKKALIFFQLLALLIERYYEKFIELETFQFFQFLPAFFQPFRAFLALFLFFSTALQSKLFILQ